MPSPKWFECADSFSVDSWVYAQRLFLLRCLSCDRHALLGRFREVLVVTKYNGAGCIEGNEKNFVISLYSRAWGRMDKGRWELKNVFVGARHLTMYLQQSYLCDSLKRLFLPKMSESSWREKDGRTR